MVHFLSDSLLSRLERPNNYPRQALLIASVSLSFAWLHTSGNHQHGISDAVPSLTAANSFWNAPGIILSKPRE